ncbi:short chain fatty acid transporter family protein [Paraburkholderia fungorum]|jgi:short-chain fatty acids transporter|uniref:Short chain fatty acid transporter family protein n=1 Tax=Paraburkholderia fungorum TaxID=134537 RepID=A0AAP5V0H7_9BURK|nr:TIGR00366 family protein [Paraburkholderia fungorum]AJZ57039.1 short chain fatty acid transporter family protein [Paraburkholderia fungorum]EIF28043.1 short chain fatty acids transporter [Burkholderia sp. Ch1-1]MDT8843329.1 TIGR00366 family protein [Paraburkholderia fungorum]
MNKVTGFFTELMRKYLPDPFVFAIVLTLLTMILAVVVQGKGPLLVMTDWGKGFWGLLAFTTQMAVILAMGYVLARAPLIDRLLDRLIEHVHSPAAAIVLATVVGGIASYINWGFGLVLGGVVARKLATRVKGVHYPLIIASAYSGFTLYGIGLSATIPIVISTRGHALEAQMGTIPLSQTIFSWPMLTVGLVLLITLPLLNIWLLPKNPQDVVEIDRTALDAPVASPSLVHASHSAEGTIAQRLNDSRLLSAVIGILGLLYVVAYFVRGNPLDVNIINFIILFVGILLLKTPANYVATLNEGIKAVSGVILQYPFYAGLMAIMAGSGLVDTISRAFVGIATPHTLPVLGIVSSFVINFFAPSAGGHWVVQGPFMIEAAKQLGAPVNQTAMAVMLGNAWNDLVQPFWLLPALALSRLSLKDIMGYTVVHMIWVGVVYIAALSAWAHWI